MPKISVLVPIYNAERYIEKCVQSILVQTLQDIEIILINDGSNDSSLDLIRNIHDSRIKLINKKNSGYGASLNIALKEARGEYVSIVEADDFIDKDMLETLYSAPKCDIIKGSFYFYPENKKYDFKINGLTSLNDSPEILNFKPSIWSAIYRKDFLIENNILFSESKGASYQDISFHFKTLFLAHDIYLINEPYYFYRTDNENSSVKNKNNPQAVIKEFNQIDDFLKNKTMLPETSAQLSLFRLKAYIWNYKRISKLYENECMLSSSDSIRSKNNYFFFASRYVKLSDKIKLLLLIKYPRIFKSILNYLKRR